MIKPQLLTLDEYYNVYQWEIEHRSESIELKNQYQDIKEYQAKVLERIEDEKYRDPT